MRRGPPKILLTGFYFSTASSVPAWPSSLPSLVNSDQAAPSGTGAWTLGTKSTYYGYEITWATIWSGAGSLSRA